MQFLLMTIVWLTLIKIWSTQFALIIFEVFKVNVCFWENSEKNIILNYREKDFSNYFWNPFTTDNYKETNKNYFQLCFWVFNLKIFKTWAQLFINYKLQRKCSTKCFVEMIKEFYKMASKFEKVVRRKFGRIINDRCKYY